MSEYQPILPLEAYGHTIRGQREENQDDLWLNTELQDGLPIPSAVAAQGAIFIVADGVGGEAYGNVASFIATRRIAERYYERADPQASVPQIEQLLYDLLKQVNRDVYDEAQQRGVAGHMGTTAVVVVVRNDTLFYGWVGDSRIYYGHTSSRQVEQLSRDHTFVEEEVRANRMTRAQAEVHPRANVLSRSIGGSFEVEPEVESVQWRRGDMVMLCSDGVINVVGDNQLADIMFREKTSKDAAVGIVQAAFNNGSSDNITSIVVYLGTRPQTTTLEPVQLAQAQLAPAVPSQQATSFPSPQSLEIVQRNRVVVGIIVVLVAVVMLGLLSLSPVYNRNTVEPLPTLVLTNTEQSETIDTTSSTTPMLTNTMIPTEIRTETPIVDNPQPLPTLNTSLGGGAEVPTDLPTQNFDTQSVGDDATAPDTTQGLTETDSPESPEDALGDEQSTQTQEANQTATRQSIETSEAALLNQITQAQAAATSNPKNPRVGDLFCVIQPTRYFGFVGPGMSSTVNAGLGEEVTVTQNSNDITVSFGGEEFVHVQGTISGWILLADIDNCPE